MLKVERQGYIVIYTHDPSNQTTMNEEFYFQQDRVSMHYATKLRTSRLLKESFSGKLIGRQGTIARPTRSPCLKPIDFFSLGNCKRHYFMQETIQELLN